MKSENYRFTNGGGHELAARLDEPAISKPRAYALFAHCFTCSKDLRAVENISKALTALGIGVLRFDFPGLGQSGGDFSETTFSSNVDDLYRAAEFLKEIREAPQILIGHSLGGAAVIRAAGLIESVRAVATIGAPADPAHVLNLFGERLGEVKEAGAATVSIAEREFLVTKAFVEDLEGVSMEEVTRKLGKALLVMHSPVDEVVGIENAGKIYERALHPKSFVSLDRADHLLTKAEDSCYVGKTIAAWAERYLERVDGVENVDEVVVRIGSAGFRTEILANGRLIVADEPAAVGGTDEGPTPYDLLIASLGTCTAMTLRMYADHKKLPVKAIEVRLRHHKIEEDGRKVDVIERSLMIEGDVTAEQCGRMAEIADRCPVHRSLSVEGEIRVVTELV